jgi:rhodanese-related sulfurtransferase
MMRTLALSVVVVAALAVRAEPPSHTKDSLETVKKMVADRKAVLVDVREQSEWDKGHLRDARLLPLSQLKEAPDPRQIGATIPKGQPVYIHCRAGRRCLLAAEVLQKLGYEVRPLKAGYDDLVEAGFPKADQ